MKHLVWIALVSAGTLLAQDPPSRVARLNFLRGAVSFEPGSVNEWAPATLNYPLTTGDRLYTDVDSNAEMQTGAASIRLNSGVTFEILNLDDRTAQVSVTSGGINVRIRRLLEDEVFEVDTPNGAVSLLRAGEYRIDTDPERNATMVTVRAGEAEVTANGRSFPVYVRQSAYLSGDGSQEQIQTANPPDYFDSFCAARDRLEDRPLPSYLPPGMIGASDLAAYGSWRDDAEYGPMWTPAVPAGWAPYHDGHWAWVAPWGWTWIDEAPWGFAPFHYGRWAYAGGGWGWIPGPLSVRPVYAPALVAFVGGGNWSAGLSLGGGAGVAWFPLGPREYYRPAYRVSETYIRQVNITNVTNVNVTNVYVNQNVPGAVTAVSQRDFVSARPVARAAINVPPQYFRGQQLTSAPPVAPQRASVLAGERPPVQGVVRPPQLFLQRTVVVRSAPPPPPVPFEAHQSVLAQHPGIPAAPAEVQRVNPNPPQREFVRSAGVPPAAPPQNRPPANVPPPNRPAYAPAPPPQTVRPQEPQYRPAYPPQQQREPVRPPEPQSRPAYQPPPQREPVRPPEQPGFYRAPPEPPRQAAPPREQPRQAPPPAAPHPQPQPKPRDPKDR